MTYSPGHDFASAVTRFFCSVKGLRGLYETRASFATQLEDAKGQTQPDSGDDLQGAVGGLSNESGVLETGRG